MSFFNFRTSSSKKPIKGVKTTDITVDKKRNLWFRLYSPSATTTTNGGGLPVIFFIHGGGFTLFAPNSKLYDDFCYRLARKLSV
ncbi:hypothetical protein JCGZ_23876 [Jatropha curcas]|uniref:Alpha/beta hydrolase fold-3 domain-containing protein n=1 Tax=Jatropha curcas TaxID=180498 RepID=A0A067LFP7_JATCU|nr:hypothetical protein JCGZ_23876 [Jatropha curcas]